MIRNYIKLWNQHFLKGAFEIQKDVFKRTIFVPFPLLSKSRFSTKLLHVDYYSAPILRHKSKSSKKKREESGSETDSFETDQFIDEIQDKNTKVLSIKVTSLRLDGILKSALGIARNKVETLFYESKIRINGEKVLKKSVSIQEGDEIDVLKGPDIKNPNFTNIARVEILSIAAHTDTISVKIRRCKSLAVDTY